MKSSNYRGVSRVGKKWKARFTYQTETYNIGTFPTEKAAATAYNLYAKHFLGIHAHKNLTSKGCVEDPHLILTS